MNVSMFVARTTKDPELRYTTGDNEIAICSTSIAVDEGWGEEKRTSFFDIIIFGKRGEAFAKHCPKGTKVALNCRARQDRWEKDGHKRSAVRFIVNEWEFAQGKADGQETDGKAKGGFAELSEDEFADLPFN